MRRATVVGLVLGLVGAVPAGCGSDGGGSASGAACTGGTPVALTVKNYLSWCSVSIAAHPASTVAVQDLCVATGAVPLSATALTGYELGSAPWHGTDGDSGSGDAGTVTGTGQSAASTTTVTATGSTRCVWICCPLAGGTGCPTANQCP